MLQSCPRILLAALSMLFLASVAAQAQVSCSGIDAWTDCCNCRYLEGQKVTDDGSLYRAAQAFTNTCEAGWKPSLAPSLWSLNGTCIVPRPSASPAASKTRVVPPVPPLATATPSPTETTSILATPAPTSTATPGGVQVVVHGAHNCDGSQQFLMLQWSTSPPHLGSSEFKVGLSPSPGGPYTATVTGSQGASVFTAIGLDALPGCTTIGNACVSYIAVATGGAYSKDVRGEIITPACSTPPPPLPTGAPMPYAPRGLVAVPGADSCDGSIRPTVLSWKPVPGAQYYNIYRAMPSTAAFEPLAWYVRDTTYAAPMRGPAEFAVYAVSSSSMTTGTRIMVQWVSETCPAPTPIVPGWRPGVTYFVGSTVVHESTYKCLQTHTSQRGWEPPNAPQLWAEQP
jgi:hypothetical protein